MRYPFRYVQRFSGSGLPVGVWEDCIVPRVPDQFLDCSIFLYPSERTAKKGTEAGGTGFLVKMRSEVHPDELWHYYAVTNKHVIDDGATTIRLNKADGAFGTISLERKDWVLTKTSSDLAAAQIEVPAEFRYAAVDTRRFITRDIIEREKIGPGDDVFLVGRFVNHDGRQKNLPCVRCGNIAISADKQEPVRLPSGKMHEAFLVELRTKSGYSGSPVFTQSPLTWSGYNADSVHPLLDQEPREGGPWLLGVHIGQMQDTVKKTGINLTDDTFMAVVIPAWHLLDLLNQGLCVMKRQDADERFSDKPAPVKLESSKEPELTKGEFEDALKKVSRRLKPRSDRPSESEQETP
jgi:hypothetical protein